MKRNVEKRLELLEKAMLPPKPKSTRPGILFHRPFYGSGMTIKAFRASLKALEADGSPVMIMSRPGDSILTGKAGAGSAAAKIDDVGEPIRPDPELEPDDADLEAEIARLEAEVKEGQKP